MQYTQTITANKRLSILTSQHLNKPFNNCDLSKLTKKKHQLLNIHLNLLHVRGKLKFFLFKN